MNPNTKHTKTMTPLGTILPDAQSLARSDAFEDGQAVKRDAQATSALPHCSRRIVDGEIRYYADERTFALASRNGGLLWFEIRADGVYSIKAKR